ncbi:hypothetical protein G6F57_014748 [Rhizopus arrhizus]|nr:hypothetical protein G6F57_014748 [Rhizopus arrhizus]
MERQFAGNQNLKSSNIGGVQCAANILNFMDSGQDQAILGEIARIDAPLSNRIQDLMFVFDDLVDLDDREMQLVLREVSGERLGLALRGADIKVRDKITRNMSQRAAEILLEDMEARGPVRLSDVEGAQREILAIVKRMADEGTPEPARAQEDVFELTEPDPEHEPEPPLQLPTLEEIQAIQESAEKEGFQHGHTEGYGQGQAEVRRLAAQIEGILDNFSRPLVRLENEVVGALGELAVRIAGALVGRAYEAEPALLAQLVGEAIDAVGGSTREVEVRLHPDDIAALAPLLNLSPQQRLVPDTSLSRGDLRVHAEAVRIDGTLEARLRGALDAPADWAVARNLRLASRLDGLRVDTAHGRGLIREGVLRRAVGLTLEAVGCEAPLGASCKVEVVDGGWVDAEVVGFAGERTYLMPSAELHGLLPNARACSAA